MFLPNEKLIIEGLSLAEVATLTDSLVLGDPNFRIYGVCPFDFPEEGKISFTKRDDLNAVSHILKDTNIKALFAPANAITTESSAINFLLTKDPYNAIIRLMEKFFIREKSSGLISKTASIHPNAKIGKNVSIGDFCCIYAGAEIGDNTIIKNSTTIYDSAKIGINCLLHSGITIRERCEIGNNVIIQNNSVIGAEGFGYIPDKTLGLKGVPQIGRVILEDYVEVGANSSIDRGTLGDTVIGRGTKIDNHVQIGHNCRIGQFSIICGQVGLAGSCNIGNQVVLGGNVKVKDHAFITDNCRFAGNTAVMTDITESGDYAGIPAQPARIWKRNAVAFTNLAETLKELKQKSDKAK